MRSCQLLKLTLAAIQNDREEGRMLKLTAHYWNGSVKRGVRISLYLVRYYKKIAKALDVAPSEFKASNGWLDRFKNRSGIKARSISGEAGDVSQTTVDSWKERLPDILQGWDLENIWNMDETGKFFRALPNKSLAESSRTCTGGKKSKERLTCAFFVNAKGGKEN